ncbi:MAG: hypothetical protein GY778_21795, partial [bacterium]|nr:hypothetical protein [bacterium]
MEFDNLQGPGEIWLPIGQRVSQQRTGESLGIWDTVAGGIADGLYQIRLRVFLNDEELLPVEFVVSGLQLVNTAPTPLPTVPADDVTEGPPPTAGPSPTSLIIQPPTNTPRPTIETLGSGSEGGGPVASGAESGSTEVNFGRLQSAFCAGSVIALVFFALDLPRERLRYCSRISSSRIPDKGWPIDFDRNCPVSDAL